MSLVIFNNAYGTIGTGVNPGDTTVNLSAGHGARFPVVAGQWTYCSLIKTDGTIEVVKVTLRATDALTVVRAQDGTTALTMAVGDRIECRPCAAAMNDILADGIDNSRKAILAGTDTYTATLAPALTAYPQSAFLFQFPNANLTTTPSINLNALGAKTIKNRDGNAPAAGDIRAGSWHVGYFDGTNFNLITLASSGYGSQGQCVLRVSSGNLTLLPLRGNLLTVNGLPCTVPDAGVTLPPTGLTTNTLYYIYATAAAGAINALVASTTGHSTSTTAGNKGTEIMTGDDTKSLVGMVFIPATVAFYDNQSNRLVRSWFNDCGITAFVAPNVTTTVYSAGWTFLNGSIVTAALWAGEHFLANGSASGRDTAISGANPFYAAVYWNGTPYGNDGLAYQAPGYYANASGQVGQAIISDGYNTFDTRVYSGAGCICDPSTGCTSVTSARH